jgi:hypothetical protein
MQWSVGRPAGRDDDNHRITKACDTVVRIYNNNDALLSQTSISGGGRLTSTRRQGTAGGQVGSTAASG